MLGAKDAQTPPDKNRHPIGRVVFISSTLATIAGAIVAVVSFPDRICSIEWSARWTRTPCRALGVKVSSPGEKELEAVLKGSEARRRSLRSQPN